MFTTLCGHTDSVLSLNSNLVSALTKFEFGSMTNEIT
jgi:hypothetical protein